MLSGVPVGKARHCTNASTRGPRSVSGPAILTNVLYSLHVCIQKSPRYIPRIEKLKLALGLHFFGGCLAPIHPTSATIGFPSPHDALAVHIHVNVHLWIFMGTRTHQVARPSDPHYRCHCIRLSTAPLRLPHNPPSIASTCFIESFSCTCPCMLREWRWVALDVESGADW